MTCAPYPCPPPIPLADWLDSSERIEVPEPLHDFDAGPVCVECTPGAHGPGAEALSDHLWLQWCARVGDLLVCAYHHDPLGDFVALVRAADGRALKGMRVAPPRHVHWPDGIDRRRAWARATAIAAAGELRARPSAGAAAGESDPVTAGHARAAAETDAWLRRQLDGLGRRRPA